MESPSVPRHTDEGSKQRSPSHVFNELKSHDDLLFPVRGSRRLKYTCISCSRQYIALGSSSGGLYIFQRDSLKYLQQVGNKEGLTKAVFSPDENIVGLATSSGTVIIWKLNVTSRQKAERLASSVSHRNRQVTSLCWDSVGLRLFSGDDKGRITITNSDTTKPSGLFKMQSEMVVDVDSSVVQMDFMEERLLISTMSRCYLCDPKKRLVFPIGSKPRDGAYGGCFLKKTASEKPAVFCARPGSRMWEANLMCQVLSTHQFKQLLATPPMPVVGQGREVTFPDRDSKQASQSLSFPALHPLGHHFLVTWNERGVYVFDPLQVDVVIWTNEIKDLLDVSISKSSLYCLYHDNSVRKYTLQTVARCAASLYHQGQLLQCTRLVLHCQERMTRSHARHHLPTHVLHDLAQQVAGEDPVAADDVEELATSIENRMMEGLSTASSRRSSFDSYDGMRLESGIYVVRKRLDSGESLDDLPLGYDAHMSRALSSSNDRPREETIEELHSPSRQAEVSIQQNHIHTNFPSTRNDTTSSSDTPGDGSRKEPVQDLPSPYSASSEALSSTTGSASSGETLSPRTDESSLQGKVIDTTTPDPGTPGESYRDNSASQEGGETMDDQDSGSDTPNETQQSTLLETVSLEEVSQMEERKSVQDHDSNGTVYSENKYLPAIASESTQNNATPEANLELSSGAKSDSHSRLPSSESILRADMKIGRICSGGDAYQDTVSVRSPLPGGDKATGDSTDGRHDVSQETEISKMASRSQDECDGAVSELDRDSGPSWEMDGGGEEDTLCDVGIVDISDMNSGSAVTEQQGQPEEILTPISTSGTEVITCGETLENDKYESHEYIQASVDNTELNQLPEDCKDAEERISEEYHSHDENNSVCEPGDEDPLSTEREGTGQSTLTSETCARNEFHEQDTTSTVDVSGFGIDTSGFGCDALEIEPIQLRDSSDSEFQHTESMIRRDPTDFISNPVNSKVSCNGFREKTIIADDKEASSEELENFDDSLMQKSIAQEASPELHWAKTEEHLRSESVIDSQDDQNSIKAPQQLLLLMNDAVSKDPEETLSHPRVSGKETVPDVEVQVSVGRGEGEKRSSDLGGIVIDESEREFFLDKLTVHPAIDADDSVEMTGLNSPPDDTQMRDVEMGGDRDAGPLDGGVEELVSGVEEKVIISGDGAQYTATAGDFILEAKNDNNANNVVSAPSLGTRDGIGHVLVDVVMASGGTTIEETEESESPEGIPDSSSTDAERELIDSVVQGEYSSGEGELSPVWPEEDTLHLWTAAAKEPDIAETVTRRKKTKSRIVDITETVAVPKTSPFSPTKISSLHRPSSLPNLSPRPTLHHQGLPSPTPTSPAIPPSPSPSPSPSPRQELSRPPSYTLPEATSSPQLMVAASTGLPHPGVLLGSTAQLGSQINLKAVKDSLTSTLSKTKTFLQSMGDSNPLSPREGEIVASPTSTMHSSLPSSPSRGSPLHRGSQAPPRAEAARTIPRVVQGGIPRSQSAGPRPKSWQSGDGGSPPSIVFSPGKSLDEVVFVSTEEKEEDRVSYQITKELISATNTAISSMEDPQSWCKLDAMATILISWVSCLERTQRDVNTKFTSGMRDFPLPQAARKDVKRLAMLCFSLDIYANEDGEEKHGAEKDREDEGTDEDDAIVQTQLSREQGEQKQANQGAGESTLSQENDNHHHHDNSISDDEDEDDHGSELGIDGAKDKKNYSNNIINHFKELSTESASDVTIFDQQRAGFIKRHFEFLDGPRLLGMLREKPGRHLKAVSALLDREAEIDANKGSSIWKALDMSDAQETFDLLLRANLSSRNPSLSMSHLKSLCALDPGLALDLMVADYPSISPWHVDHILSAQSGKRGLVLDYVQSFLATFPRSEWSGFIEQVHSVEELLLAIIAAALTFDPPCHEDLFCACGKLPRPGSHLTDWCHDEILSLLLTYPTVPDTVLPLLERAGYWKGVLAVMKKSGPKMPTLRLCVQLGDFSLIQDEGRGLLPSSDEEWTSLLQWMEANQPSLNPDGSPKVVSCLNCGVSLAPICLFTHSSGTPLETQLQGSPPEDVSELSPSSQPECDWSVQTTPDQSDQLAQGIDLMPNHSKSLQKDSSFEEVPHQGKSQNIMDKNSDRSLPESNMEDSHWLPTITWQRVAFLLVRHVGAQKGVQLLRYVRPPDGALTREFQQMCILSSVWEKQQSLLCHAMLEGTATYLWSKGQPLLGPRLQHTVLSELQSIRGDQKGSSSVAEKVLSLRRQLSRKQLFIEDPNTHWGTCANLAGICGMCRQPLSMMSSMQMCSCLVFPCGHCYHSTCLTEKVCMQCFYQRP